MVPLAAAVQPETGLIHPEEMREPTPAAAAAAVHMKILIIMAATADQAL
jgi:hypothetical protein